MKKILAGTALAVACLAPLSAAKAADFCTTGLTLNFCGSVVITTVPSGTGTLVSIKVLNTSGGVAGGNPLAVFTAIGLTDVSSWGTLGSLSVTSGGTGHWELNTNEQGGGGINVDINNSTTNGVHYALSSFCSGAATPDAVYTGGSGINGPCGLNYVTFSFTSSVANLTIGDFFIKAQGANSSECDFSLNGTGISCNTTTVPEPASIVLVGTGLMALGRRASRWRRRNHA